MKNWLLLFVPLLCIACGEPPTTSSAEQGGGEVKQEASSNKLIAAEPASTIKLVTEEINYTVDGEPFTGFLAYDEAIEGKRPGVLVVHEWWGHNEYARTRAVQLARMGYTAFSLDMYGAGKVTDHPDNAMAFMQMATKDPEQVKERFLKAKQILEQQSTVYADKIAAIGYCFGGGVVLNMARAGVDLDGVASFHGSLAATQVAAPGSVEAKVLVLNGADDTMTPAEQIEAFKTEMDAAGVDYEFINYPGAQHSFTNPGATEAGKKYNMPLAYNEQADEQSWEKLQEFLNNLWP
ncbi:MAG: dienelactone hydrolase family protein [Spongiibacteraceae bacterium]